VSHFESDLHLPYISLASALHMCKADAREKQGRSKKGPGMKIRLKQEKEEK